MTEWRSFEVELEVEKGSSAEQALRDELREAEHHPMSEIEGFKVKYQ